MIRYQKDTDNIVTLSLDMEGRPVNVINHEIGAAFFPVIEHLKEEKAKGKLRGLIFTSTKRTFLSGGDLEYLFKADDPEEIFSLSEKLKHFLREIESPGVPVVAAINGTALGAGFEMALACHHRILIDHPRIRVGFPEVHLGLIPGSGGIVRMMWLLGIENAFPILSKGHSYAPKEALKAGIIDELAHDRKDMLEKSKAWLLATKEGRRPWDRKDGKIPGGTAHEHSVASTIRRMAVALAKEHHNNLLAPQAILNVLHEGSKVDFDTACRIESRYFTELLRSKQCKNMIKTFWFDHNDIESGISRPKGYGKFRPKKVGIIGAGQMGSGIALTCLSSGLEVVLKDVSRLIAERGRDYVSQKLDRMESSGQLTAVEKQDHLARILTTEDPRDFKDCDLVIEAVFENQMVKQKVTREAETYTDEYTLFASNAISIPISKLAKTSVRPQNYIGLHFFAPAEDVQLVEIVRGDETSEESVARAFDFVKSIHKTPIVVKDDWGFYVGRVKNTYILEGITMLQEGFSPPMIENLGRKAGMPKGALEMADEIGLNIVLRYEKQAAEHYGNKYTEHPAVTVLNKMIEAFNRPGKVARSGFYDYPHDQPHLLWPELTEHFPPKEQVYHDEDIIERFLFAQVIEAIWCMQEGVINSIPEANLGSIHGWGFPAFKGGVIQYIIDYGKAAFISRCKHYEEKHGQRFKVPKFLRAAGYLRLGIDRQDWVIWYRSEI